VEKNGASAIHFIVDHLNVHSMSFYVAYSGVTEKWYNYLVLSHDKSLNNPANFHPEFRIQLEMKEA